MKNENDEIELTIGEPQQRVESRLMTIQNFSNATAAKVYFAAARRNLEDRTVFKFLLEPVCLACALKRKYFWQQTDKLGILLNFELIHYELVR